VSRAYANFNSKRPGDGERPWDYYLQGAAKTLMERGIEPVQVFRFPGGGNKNAADMRLAMDAMALFRDNPRIQQITLVSGDADFIPMILELRKVGMEVIVIGVREHTKAVLERYCDRFEYFEDLVAAEENGSGKRRELEQARLALRAVLQGRGGLRLDALKPLLHGELGHTFDYGRFECESLGEFIEAHADELEVLLDRDEEGVSVALRSPAAPPAAPRASGAGPASHEGAAPALGHALVAERGEALPADDGQVPPAAQDGERVVILRPHSAYLYRELLRLKAPKIYVVPARDWSFVMETTHSLVVDEGGQPRVILHRDLREDLIQVCDAHGMDNAEKKVDATLFQLFKAGCFVCVERGPDVGQSDFHWRRPARLADGLATIDHLRDRVRLFMIRELRARLAEAGLSTAIEVDVLSAELDGFNAPPESVSRLHELVGAG
jgi:hypothetical protein